MSSPKFSLRNIPSPFSLALLLTILAVLLTFILTDIGGKENPVQSLAGYWQDGFWSLLTFTMQMMLILVLGYVLALSKPINRLIGFLVRFCRTTSTAAAIVAFSTMLIALINWGLGLVYGAILARKVGEHAAKQNIPLNYPLIGAAGYVGLMVWHGGLSGSAPVTIASADHHLVEQMGVMGVEQTIFSGMNIIVSLLLLILVPLFFYWLGKPGSNGNQKAFQIQEVLSTEAKEEKISWLDRTRWLAYLTGGSIVLIAAFKGFSNPNGFLASLSLNYINFVLFGLGLLFHGSIARFVKSFESAITSSAGIMLQFPLYAGLIGIMKGTGLIDVFSGYFVSIANEWTFPIFTFISAAVVNVFVPSGGGQWAVQGPIIIEAAKDLGVPLHKSVMALAYGDQLTNMLQPFWALPLLGITGLSAGDILPYSLRVMFLGAMIFIVALLLF